MKKWMSEIFTDVKGRPEIKNMIGIPGTIAGVVVGLIGLVGLVKLDWTGWGIYMGFCVGLITVTAVADAQIDNKG